MQPDRLWRLERVASAEKAVLAFVAMGETVERRLLGSTGSGRHVFRTLDSALKWREATALADGSHAPVTPLSARLTADFDDPDAAAVFLEALEVVEFTADDVILRQGDTSNELLFIEEGRASVMVHFRGSEPMRVRAVS